VQFGINGNPAISQKWENADINDDPVLLRYVREIGARNYLFHFWVFFRVCFEVLLGF
jgi:hypothetical protein